MATLHYDIDNFSGRYLRGIRYDIYVNGYKEYSDASEEEVDRLCDELDRKYCGEATIEVKER